MLSNDEHVANLASITVKLLIENIELKRQIESDKIQRISTVVADHVDNWLSRPYQGKSERHDIEQFSKEITTFIYYELKN